MAVPRDNPTTCSDWDVKTRMKGVSQSAAIKSSLSLGLLQAMVLRESDALRRHIGDFYTRLELETSGEYAMRAKATAATDDASAVFLPQDRLAKHPHTLSINSQPHLTKRLGLSFAKRRLGPTISEHEVISRPWGYIPPST